MYVYVLRSNGLQTFLVHFDTEHETFTYVSKKFGLIIYVTNICDNMSHMYVDM